MKISKGFTAVEALLILVIVGILGFTGYYVYNSHKKTEDTLTKAAAINQVAQTTKKTTPAVDPTADWTTYVSKTGQFTVKYPKTWVTGTNQANCDGYLMLGTTAGTAGHCQSEATGEVHVVSLDGNVQKDNQLDQTQYTNYGQDTVTINGVSCGKQSGTFKGPVSESGFGPAVGANQVVYICFTNNKTFVAAYDQEPSYPDMLADFNTMVTKTLKFSS